MADMHKFGAIEHFAVTLAFDVCTDEAAHPIIVDDNRGEDFQLAEGLKSDECKEYKLLGDVKSSFSIIRL
jgi:hypothetical protein